MYILQVQTLRYFGKQSSFLRYSRNSKSHPAWFTQSPQLTNSAITLFRMNTCMHLENALVYQNIHFMSCSVLSVNWSKRSVTRLISKSHLLFMLVYTVFYGVILSRCVARTENSGPPSEVRVSGIP